MPVFLSRQIRLSTFGLLAGGAIGGGLILAGSPLVWASADLPLLGSIDLDGFAPHRDGEQTLAIGIALLVVLLTPVSVDLRARAVLVAVLAAAALAVALIDAGELSARRPLVDRLGFALVEPSVGIGLLLVLAGSGLALAASIITAVTSHVGRASTPADPAIASREQTA